jgi:hypothetical protein
VEKKIILPPYIEFGGIRHLAKGFPKKINLIVGDTETVKGEPYTIQLFDGQTMSYTLHSNEDILETFVKYVRKRTQKDAFNLVYFHGLDFDAPVLLHEHHRLFVDNDFKVSIGNLMTYWEVKCGKFTFADMFCPEGQVRIYDTYRFVMTSLSKACIDLKLPFKKVKAPSYLGERKPKSHEMKAFQEYAIGDVYALWELANWVLDRCREYDVIPPVSIAQFAGMVLRRKFMKKGDSMEFPPKSCVTDSVLSYHGGKNGLYIKTPVRAKKVFSYDLISAYPWAMKQLPSFLEGEYKRVKKFDPNHVGIYCVAGEYIPCKYNLFYTHTFKPIKEKGPISNLCVTSFELQEAIEKKHFIPEKIRGWVWVPKSTRSPLAEYVDHFFEMKKKSKDSTMYWIGKFALNSLYGKFIQTVDYNQGEKVIAKVKKGTIEIVDRVFKAGGLFNPFIASLITGLVRVKLHQLEHKYKAIHSSTDSILTLKEAETGPNLGDLKFENLGPLLLVRNKLFIHWDIDGKTIAKEALHGFQSDVKTLLNLEKTKKNTYKIRRMVRLKETFKNINLNLKPLMMHNFDKELNVDWGEMYEL